MIVIGGLLILAAPFYSGSYNRAFGRGKPDHPPGLRMRLILVGARALFVVAGITRVAASW